MKRIVRIVAAVGLFALGMPVQAAENGKPVTPQQAKMKACNQEAGQKQLKGDARKEFMRGCLSAKKPVPLANSAASDAKHGACAESANGADGKPLAGAARASFMKKCVAGE